MNNPYGPFASTMSEIMIIGIFRDWRLGIGSCNDYNLGKKIIKEPTASLQESLVP